MTQALLEPAVQLNQQWSGMRLAVTVAFISGSTAHLLLDGVEFANEHQRLVGHRAERVVLALMNFVKFSAAMRPARSLNNLAVRKDPVITSIGISLQYPSKAAQMTPRILTLAVLGVLVPNRRRRWI